LLAKLYICVDAYEYPARDNICHVEVCRSFWVRLCILSVCFTKSLCECV